MLPVLHRQRRGARGTPSVGLPAAICLRCRPGSERWVTGSGHSAVAWGAPSVTSGGDRAIPSPPPHSIYHARAVLKDLDGGPWKPRIAEPQRKGVSRWHGDADARRAVYNNRARLRSAVGKQAMRQRAERVERSFAHILDRGGLRRTWLRGREKVHKRYLIHVAGHNLGLLMRQLIGAGTPKEAVARGWCVLILLPTSNGAAYAAILMDLVAHSAIPALIILNMRLDRRPD